MRVGGIHVSKQALSLLWSDFCPEGKHKSGKIQMGIRGKIKLPPFRSIKTQENLTFSDR